jgi:NitT/TauT family transport system ATP-binding protein
MNLVSLKDIKFAPKNEQGIQTCILEDVNLELNSRQIVSLLGRSGSGKSTLLRIIAGLIEPTEGEVIFNQPDLKDRKDAIAMVFQTFALFPWLNASQNIEIALRAQGLSDNEIKNRVSRMIEIIGLQGHENIFPKELSGGMRQRVGFARALSIHPQILLLDEPFSTLDIITAQTLRTDFLDLWNDNEVPLNSVLIVTHNIEEAVLLSDSIKIFASHPGRIVAEIDVHLPHPRDRLDPKFIALVEDIYSIMTNKLANESNDLDSDHSPKATYSSIYSFMEFILSPPYNGTANLPELSSGLDLEIDDLFPIIDSLKLLKFADIREETISITSSGKLFTNSDQKTKKNIFAEHLIQYVPLIGQIRRRILNEPNQKVTKEQIIIELQKNISKDNAEQVLKAIISWGRFAGIFVYNDTNKSLYIP